MAKLSHLTFNFYTMPQKNALNVVSGQPEKMVLSLVESDTVASCAAIVFNVSGEQKS
jgi:hypothetical protein